MKITERTNSVELNNILYGLQNTDDVSKVSHDIMDVMRKSFDVNEYSIHNETAIIDPNKAAWLSFECDAEVLPSCVLSVSPRFDIGNSFSIAVYSYHINNDKDRHDDDCDYTLLDRRFIEIDKDMTLGDMVNESLTEAARQRVELMASFESSDTQDLSL